MPDPKKCNHDNVTCVYEGEPYFDGCASEVSYTDPIYECDDCGKAVILMSGKFYTKKEHIDNAKAWVQNNIKYLDSLGQDIPF